MKTIVRKNERSWAIVIISEIRLMLERLDLKIKSVGGESTLSSNKKSMFPDLLLYADKAQTKILQGWELKMPDVPITDSVLIADASRKANVLGLNSFVIWNFTYGKLYIQDEAGEFQEARIWNGTSHITSREDVMTYKDEWLPVIKDIVITVNDFLVKGEISDSSIVASVSDGIITEIIQRNKSLVAEHLAVESNHNMSMESRLKVWWNDCHEEYSMDESNMYSAYSKTILMDWANRIMFANTIKRYHNNVYLVDQIDNSTSPEEGNAIFKQIVKSGDFYNIFKGMDFNDLIPEDAWIDIVDFNQFLIENKIEKIDQQALQDVLEKTVATAKREIRGQYATPYALADLLCQITVEDWNKDCADLCAGTGTIAKALINNKSARSSNIQNVFSTTWISDKYAYPLQIANIAVADFNAMNTPLNIFQSDVFAVNSSGTIEIRDPNNGSMIQKTIPRFGAIVSNLPFVKYNRIGEDEQRYMATWQTKIKESTGIEFTLGKTDLYNYIPFKLHELLDEDGNLGLILSNSWLGTDIGKKFFCALQFYYDIQAVVISDNKRWFRNADVIGSILLLKKKKLSAPNEDHIVSFWLVHKDIYDINNSESAILVNSIVLGEILNANVATCRKYSYHEIEQLLNYGITLNALFHDVSWLSRISDNLVPISEYLEVKRGERRGWNDLFYPSSDNRIEPEYIKPVLKKPANLKSCNAIPDTKAFCCHRSKDELKTLGHMGALRWIEKFEQIDAGNGKPLPIALKRSGSYWYEMDDSTKADYVTAVNPDKRLFVAKFEEPTFVDQRFTRMLLKDENVNQDLLHAVLNSVYGMFAIEAIGFGRGLGVLDASSNRLKNMFIIDVAKISSKDTFEILDLFYKVKNRTVLDVEDELSDPVRITFDKAILRAIGCESLYNDIKNSLLSMQHTRHSL